MDSNSSSDPLEASGNPLEASSGGNVAVGSKTRVVLAPKWLGKRVGRFKLLALLGQGAMGRVFRAEDTLMARHVALKLLPRTLKRGHSSVAAEMLIREARTAAAIEHPGAVQIYEINEAGDVYYIAMELLEGGSLRDLVKAAGPLDVTRACLLAAEAAEALAHAHSVGVVHRDVKPANLMLTRTGRCKVVDFGLARVEDPSDLTSFLAESVGTPQFIAPEILTGTPASPQSDIYSLAATIWYLLCGHPPFEAGTAQDLLQKHVSAPLPDLRAICPHVPQGLADALSTALSKRPMERYSSMEQFAKVLRMQSIPIAASAEHLELPPAPTMAPPAAPTMPSRPASPLGPQRPASPGAAIPSRPSRPATPFEQSQSVEEPEAIPQQQQAKSKIVKRIVPWWKNIYVLAGGGIAAAIILVIACVMLLSPASNTGSQTNNVPAPAPSPAPAVPPAPHPAPVVVKPPPPAPVVTVPALPLGDFEAQSDIGGVPHRGYVEFSAADHRYTVTGSGADIYGKTDAFHYVYRTISGDASMQADIAFVGTSKESFRKACLMFRANTNPDAAYVDAAVHGSGLISLQWRDKAGAITNQKSLQVKAPATVRLERRGNVFTLFTAKEGEPMKSQASITVDLKNPIDAGLAVGSHSPTNSETAIFSSFSLITGSHP